MQILRGDVNALLGKNLVKRGQHARTIFMDVHQTTAAVQRLEDEWVDVYFDAASTTSEDALCIETRFIRQDDGGSYVYRRGEDQLLHKQYVTTGVVQWGYTEIKSGLTADDWIAFPYGKDVKENAETIESDNSDDFYYYGSY